jgi:hypothetical protein
MKAATPFLFALAALLAAQDARTPGPAADLAQVLKIARRAPPLSHPPGATIRVADVAGLRKAVSEAAPGTTILLADGVYPLEELLVTGSKLTIRGESGDREKVVLDGGGKFTRIVRIRGAKDLTIADITVANSRQYGIFFLGDSGVERLNVYNVKFHNCYVRGLKGTMATRSNDSASKILSPEETERVRPRQGQVRYCLFVNDGVTPNDEPYGGDYVSGIDAMWLKDWVIADNTFVNIRGQHGGGRGAIFVWVNSENVVVERNLIVNCDRGICFGNPSGDPLHMTRGMVRNNFIVAGLGQAIEICRTRDTAVLHNTIFCERPGQRTVQFHQLAGAGNRFLNNLVSGSLLLPDEVTEAGNVTGALAEWFVAPRLGDLRLTPKAARGNPASAGAHER